MAGGLGARWGGVQAEPGGARGAVGGLVLPQGWVFSPAISLALCMHGRGSRICLGGLFPCPSLWRGPVVPGKAGSQEPAGYMSMGLCWEPLTLSLTPGLRSCSAMGPCPMGLLPGRGTSRCPRAWGVGCRDPSLHG